MHAGSNALWVFGRFIDVNHHKLPVSLCYIETNFLCSHTSSWQLIIQALQWGMGMHVASLTYALTAETCWSLQAQQSWSLLSVVSGTLHTACQCNIHAPRPHWTHLKLECVWRLLCNTIYDIHFMVDHLKPTTSRLFACCFVLELSKPCDWQQLLRKCLLTSLGTSGVHVRIPGMTCQLSVVCTLTLSQCSVRLWHCVTAKLPDAVTAWFALPMLPVSVDFRHSMKPAWGCVNKPCACIESIQASAE